MIYDFITYYVSFQSHCNSYIVTASSKARLVNTALIHVSLHLIGVTSTFHIPLPSQVCSPTECECKGCKNTQANSGPYGIRTKTIEEIMLRRPDAFEPRTRDADEGCRCKKNRCLKKYCVSLFVSENV